MDDDSRGRQPKFRRRAEARPDELLDAALDLFIEQGFAATRVDDIARRAGISKGAVYLYFPSKEAILEALVRRALVPVAETALAAAAGFSGDPRPVIVTILRTLALRLHEPRLIAIPKLIVREVVKFPALAEMYRKEVLDQVIPVATALIQRGIDDGYFRPVDASLTVRSLVGPVIAHVLLAEIFGITGKSGLDLDGLIENHLAILFDGLSLPQQEAGQ